jgi:hypothetical protein
MDGSTTAHEILVSGLQAANTEHTKAVLKNPDLFAFLLTNFNNTIKLASGKPADIVVGIANKTLATGKLVGKSSGNDGLLLGVSAAQILVITAGLVTIVGKGPGAAIVAIGAAFAKKTSLALGLAGTEDKKAKCLAAIADVAAAGLTTAMVAPTAATGIGAVVLAGSVAQLILSGYQAHQACTAK